MSETTMRRLKELVKRSETYEAFKAEVVRWPKWYLRGLQEWTSATLYAFYGQQKGK